METIREEELEIEGGTIPISLKGNGEKFEIYIDGVYWATTDNRVHAVVLYEMMADNITEYVHYQKVNK